MITALCIVDAGTLIYMGDSQQYREKANSIGRRPTV